MAKLTLVREHQLASEFRKAVRKSPQGVVAVPFWGKGAVETLGLQAGSGVRVICNLNHPGCNPDVIEQLQRLKIKVRTHSRLHAKIYATPNVAIVGSSNASSNGLTEEGDSALGWIEANVLSSEIDFVTDVLHLFETIWNSDETRPVRPADIRKAREQRAKLPPIFFQIRDIKSLFDGVRNHPEAFASVYLAAYGQSLSKNGNRVLKKVRSGIEPPRPGLDISNFKKAWGYQFNDIPEDAWLVDLDCTKLDRPKVWGTARATGVTLSVDSEEGPETDLALAIPGPIIIGGRKFRLLPAEKKRLLASAGQILEFANNKLLPLSKVLKIAHAVR